MQSTIGQLKIPEDQDFHEAIKIFKDKSPDWELKYKKNNIEVNTKYTEYSHFKIIKIESQYAISASTMYDVIHDEEYRKEWDNNMLEGFQISKVSDNSDITYYALKSPFMFKNRDFVTQRCWKVLDNEYFIFNHSVFHKKYPEKKGFVRGISFVTGYLIKHISENECHFIYVSQSDPRGYIPAWAINRFASMIAPKVLKRLEDAVMKYKTWKALHNPDYKPWLNPSQSKLNMYSPNDILTVPDYDVTEIIDESKMTHSEGKTETEVSLM